MLHCGVLIVHSLWHDEKRSSTVQGDDAQNDRASNGHTKLPLSPGDIEDGKVLDVHREILYCTSCQAILVCVMYRHS